MTVKASTSITIAKDRDTQSVTRFYKIAPSTSTPTQPTGIGDPSGWQKVEPAYDGTSTNSLYFTDRTLFTDGTVSWSPVSKSSSYEASKQAYNKAEAAAKSASAYMTDITDDGVFVHEYNTTKPEPGDAVVNGVHIHDSVDIYKDGAKVAEYGTNARIGKQNGSNVLITDSSIQMLKNGTVCSQFTLPTTSGYYTNIYNRSKQAYGLKSTTPTGTLAATFYLGRFSYLDNTNIKCTFRDVITITLNSGRIYDTPSPTYSSTDTTTWFWYAIEGAFLYIYLNKIPTDHADEPGFLDYITFFVTISAQMEYAPAYIGCNANMGSSSYAFAVGNGLNNNISDFDKSNAMTVDWSGNFVAMGMAGIIQMFAGDLAAIPRGWLICDGSEYMAAAYPYLNDVLGGDSMNGVGATLWGVASKDGYFKVPDFRGYAPVGAKTGVTNRELGNKYGTETVTLNANQSGVPAHSHPLGYDSGYSTVVSNTDLGENKVTKGSTTTSQFIYKTSNTGDVKRSGKTSTNNNTAANATAAHNNMQPSAFVNFIICTGELDY